MLLHVPQLLSAVQVAEFRRRLAQARWADGRITAGHQSGQVKHNEQLADTDPAAQELGSLVRAAVVKNPLFFAAALPRRVFPPLFNRYREGNGFGSHVDNAIRYDSQGEPVRTDVSVTLFLSDPSEYDGGELVIDGPGGAQRVRLPAGDLVLYPSTSVHRVEPVGRGERLACFFWLQSLVRDAGQRQLLFDLDLAIQKLNRETSASPAQRAAAVELVSVYHNLLRRWSDV